MPLTVKRPGRSLFLPLIEKMEKRLEGWSGKMISRGGRLQPINSVLAAIPVYHMSCFKLPAWVIKRMNKICRMFLWGNSSREGPGISLTNWEVVCIPKKHGGMGVVNLEFRNNALLLRWLWKLYSESDSLWQQTAKLLLTRYLNDQLPKIWIKGGSFFLKFLHKIKSLFFWSTQWRIGNGESISFWFDGWHGLPLAGSQSTRLDLPSVSLKQASSIMHELVPNLPSDLSITFTQERDALLWRWNAQGEYSSSSFYKMLMLGGKENCQFHGIWKLKIPPTVRIFVYLTLKGKILTHDVMARRGFNCSLQCPLCSICPVETAVHLLFTCPYAVRVWNRVRSILGQRIMWSEDEVDRCWMSSWNRVRTRMQFSVWGPYFVAVCWQIWKQRNARLFERKTIPAVLVADRAVQEGLLWIRHC